MTKGCKIWLWIIFICAILSTILGVISMVGSIKQGLYSVITGVIMAIGIALLLFNQKKVGFYLMVIIAIVSLIFNVMNNANIILAVVSAVISPAITYYFIRKNAAVFT